MPRRALRPVLRTVALGGLLAVVWSVVVLVAVRGDLQSAREDLESVRAADDFLAARDPLASAERHLMVSVDRLRQPGPALVARMPVLGRTVAAVRRTSQAALTVTSGARDILAVVDAGAPLLAGGRVDLERLQDVERQLSELASATEDEVDALQDQPLGLVPSAVAGPALEAREELEELEERLADTAAGLRGLRAVLGADEPQQLLVLLENNAELRATGGIVTVFATAVADDGRLQLDAFRDVEEVADVAHEARRVPAPADFADLYGRFKADTTLWKNANMSPDVPTSSAVLAAAAAASTGVAPDALLWLDVPTIASIVRATGPVDVPDGGVLSADDVVPRLLSMAYRDAPDTEEGQTRRRAELRSTADAVAGRLLGDESELSFPALARELFSAAVGRHLALWSADPVTQAALEQAGVAGAVAAGDADLSAVAVHNLGGGDADGNKLDFYGRRQTSVRVELGPDAAVVEQEVSLRNTAPPSGLPVYVAGRRTPGVMNAFVTLALPRDAGAVTVSRDGNLLRSPPRPAGDHSVVTDVVAVPPGRVVTWRLRYRLPVRDGRYGLTLFPQPLPVDSGLLVHVRPAEGLELVDVEGLARDEAGAGRSGAFAATTRVSAAVKAPGLLARWQDAIQRFWTEPVRLP